MVRLPTRVQAYVSMVLRVLSTHAPSNWVFSKRRRISSYTARTVPYSNAVNSDRNRKCICMMRYGFHFGLCNMFAFHNLPL